MKSYTQTHGWAGGWSVGCLAGLLLLLPINPVPAAESESQMERMETLERQAQRLKAAGEGEKARQLMREAEELRAKTPREGRDRDLPGPEALEERRTDLKRKLKELQGDLKELRQAGRQDAAAKAEQQIGRIEEELARLSRPEGVVKRPDRPTPPERLDLARPQGPEWEKRRHHLELALDNLRAAGMPELADRIAAQAKSQPRELARPEAPLLRRAEAAREELQRMRAELQELRQMVRELHARMDELSRQRR